MAEDGQILFFTVAVKDLDCLIPILSKGHAPHIGSFVYLTQFASGSFYSGVTEINL